MLIEHELIRKNFIKDDPDFARGYVGHSRKAGNTMHDATPKDVHITIFKVDTSISQPIPFSESLISAGFPSSAENFIERTLDINDLLIKHPVSTFYIRVIGDSMVNAGINSGDILVVDRSLSFTNNKIAVVRINNEFTVKRINFTQDKILLLAENENYAPIEITPEMDFEVWGMVTFVIHKV